MRNAKHIPLDGHDVLFYWRSTARLGLAREVALRPADLLVLTRPSPSIRRPMLTVWCELWGHSVEIRRGQRSLGGVLVSTRPLATILAQAPRCLQGAFISHRVVQ